MSARALIFHMSIPCDKSFLFVLLLTLIFDLFFKIDIGHNFCFKCSLKIIKLELETERDNL